MADQNKTAGQQPEPTVEEIRATALGMQKAAFETVFVRTLERRGYVPQTPEQLDNAIKTAFALEDREAATKSAGDIFATGLAELGGDPAAGLHHEGCKTAAAELLDQWPELIDAAWALAPTE